MIDRPVIESIIRKLLRGEDYRVEIVTLIDADFFTFAISFFKKVVAAKIQNQEISSDWYRSTFLHDGLPKTEIAINSGLNMKTISNMFNSATRDIVIDASNAHYEELLEVISELSNSEPELELNFTIKFSGVSVDLNLSESLIVLNAIAVQRAALRGGAWSTIGKRVEKPLMLTLCHLYGVDEVNYSVKGSGAVTDEFEREIDFYLNGKADGSSEYKCEIKLMGKGNPESADAVIARSSKVFIADKLSEANKRQLNKEGIAWVELRDVNGFHKFREVLLKLEIPHDELSENYEEALDSIFSKIF